MNIDDTISKINSIDPIALEERLRIKSPQEKTIWKIPLECIPNGNVVTLSIAEAKLILDALLRLPVEGNKALLKQTLIPLKEKIEKAEKVDE